MRTIMLPPTVWLFTIIAMLLAHEYFPVLHTEPVIWRTAPGLALIVIALIITIWHKRLFKKEKTNIDTFGKPDKLIDQGLFRYIRNPMYLGFVLALAGLALLGGALSSWIIAIAFFVLVDRWYIPFEEREMLARFGDQYQEYCRRTRRWL